MRICILVASRNKSIAVKTLHTLLRFNILCMQNNVRVEITFVVDDPFERNSIIMKKMKEFDRLLFIDYSVFVDEKSLALATQPLENGQHCMVFPAVTEGVDWDMFRSKINSESSEPIEQMGLNFDTEVGRKIKDDIYSVTKTNPKAWFFDCKPVIKTMREKKGEGIKLPTKNSEMFEKFISKGLKVCAFTDANLVLTYSHECVGNILNTAGVTHN